jgi:sodium/potassium-transporting ATPase subunit alpha
VSFGEKVPADLRILEAINLKVCAPLPRMLLVSFLLTAAVKVDNSSLTGEPEPLRRVPEKTDDNPFETKNLAFYGTFFTEGSGTAVVYATGDRTFLGNIASATTGTAAPESTLQKEIHIFIKVLCSM